MSNNFYVYEHWWLDRDECFYVGKGKGRRAYNMVWRNPYHKAIQTKVANEGFAIEVKIIASGLSEKEAFSLEIERIAFWRSAGIELANMTGGGEGISNPSEEVRKKISKAKIGNKNMVGRKLSEETKNKISKAHSGKKPNWDVINKLSEINKGHKRSVGKKDSAETRAKMSAARMGNKYAQGRIWTEEARKKVSERNKGKKMSPEAIEKTTKASRKPVRCLTDGKIFISAIEAGKFYGLFNHAKVAEVCRGVRKTAAGRTFEYIKDEN